MDGAHQPDGQPVGESRQATNQPAARLPQLCPSAGRWAGLGSQIRGDLVVPQVSKGMPKNWGQNTDFTNIRLTSTVIIYTIYN